MTSDGERGYEVPYAIGVDLGGTNIKVAVVSQDGKIIIGGVAFRNLEPSGIRFMGRLERYWSDGTRDLRFGQRGRTIVDLGNVDLSFKVLGCDNRYLIASGFLHRTEVAITARFFATRKL